jgi:hypothetical protein
VSGEETTKNTDGSLERVEISIAVKVKVVLAPLGGTVVLVLETHDQQRVKRVDNCVSDSTDIREVGTTTRNGVKLVLAPSTLL